MRLGESSPAPATPDSDHKTRKTPTGSHPISPQQTPAERGFIFPCLHRLRASGQLPSAVVTGWLPTASFIDTGTFWGRRLRSRSCLGRHGDPNLPRRHWALGLVTLLRVRQTVARKIPSQTRGKHPKPYVNRNVDSCLGAGQTSALTSQPTIMINDK